MLNKSCAIAILARDCEDGVKRNSSKIDTLSSYFEDSNILIIENDSVDQTKYLLNEWKKTNNNISIISQDHIFRDSERKGSSQSRIERMAILRNKYIEYFANQEKRYDYLIVIDIDIEYFEPKEIVNAIIEAPEDWVGIFANGRFFSDILGHKVLGKYYDNYAYVPYNSRTYDLTYPEIRINNDHLCKNLKHNHFIKCKSAFGGIGIYKYSYALKCKYSARNNSRSEYYHFICEHIPFNEEISRYGSLYIDSKMTVFYEHMNFIKLLLTNHLKQENIMKFYATVLKKELPDMGDLKNEKNINC